MAFKALYVEDDKASRTIMKTFAQFYPDLIDLTIFEDSSNFEARLAKLGKLDVVFLDIHMKPLNGFQMLEIVRKCSWYSEAHIIAITASVMTEEIQKLKVKGFHSVFAKPIDFDALPRMIQRVLNNDPIWYVV